ncbi:MAG: beta-ketoacyl-[acyl-carrier-protein] synthase II, partial [Caldilineaceae bacterium SB0666_bin_21]|nr:beta-ketoacyl-[acyl-carrier-protein] synthase II [Caldilineaceae bacterium SB0666_bin_21]
HAIKGVFGEHAYDVNISSTKSMMGHLMGAAGSVEAIMAVKSVDEDTVPPTINLHTPDPDCDLNYTPNVAQQRPVQAAMNNSIGLGGNNSSMIFSKPD